MKTNVEINGYVISIEEENGVISVNATKDDEVVEEFTIQTEEGEGDDDDHEGDDVKTFGDYDEEEDFEDLEEDEDDEFEGQGDDDDDEFEGQGDDDDDFEEMPSKGSEPALESFQSFINKKRKKLKCVLQ